MQLSKEILECQKLGADKELKFGCLLNTSNGLVMYLAKSNYNNEEHKKTGFNNYTYGIRIKSQGKQRVKISEYTNLGKQIDYSRLCYLMEMGRTTKIHRDMFYGISMRFINNPELYNQTILERPDELVSGQILPFLLSLQPND